MTPRSSLPEIRIPSGLEPFRHDIEAALQPCVLLEQTGEEVTGSFLGGNPVGPPELSWPSSPERPMSFLGQLDCEELDRAAPGIVPIRNGTLMFFYDTDRAVSGRHPEDRDYWTLVYSVENRSLSHSPPEGACAYPRVGLVPRLGTSFRSPLAAGWPSREFVFEHWDDLWTVYSEITGRDMADDIKRHQVGGHPEWIQYEAFLPVNTRQAGARPTDAASSAPIAGDANEGWCLLWQLSAIEEMGFLTEPYGTLYILAKKGAEAEHAAWRLNRQFT
jgi:hypothetical protein